MILCKFVSDNLCKMSNPFFWEKIGKNYHELSSAKFVGNKLSIKSTFIDRK